MDPSPSTLLNKPDHTRRHFGREVSLLATLKDTRTHRNEPYVYQPIPSGGYLRYLALEPGSGDEPLRCSLYTHKIRNASYEALSYVWGSEIKDQNIYCDGYTIKITRNLCEALRRLRSPTDVRKFWADSICINQDDVEEKGHQVAIMGQIYSSASRVLIYIGSDIYNRGLDVASLLSDVRDFLESKIVETNSFEWDSFPDQHEYAGHPLLEDERWFSFSVLLEQKWFQRGWVVQEAGLAREALVIWDNGEFSWEDLMRTSIWIYEKRIVLPPFPSGLKYHMLGAHVDCFVDHLVDRHWDTVRLFTRAENWAPPEVLGFLAIGRHLQFKDRRDGIYAFLDICLESTDRSHIAPDYTQPTDEVFRAFAIQHIHATGDQAILNYVIHDPQSLHSEFPTWIPRWDAIEPGSDDYFWRGVPPTPSRDTVHDLCRLEIFEGSILGIRGTLLDTVDYVWDTFSTSTTTPALVLNLWRKKVRAALPIAEILTQYTLHDFVLTLGMFDPLGPNVEETQQTLAEFVHDLELHGNAVENTDPSTEKSPSMLFKTILSQIVSKTNAKRFMLTRQGCFGLAPVAAQQGDIIARLFGSNSLPPGYVYLLRATDTPLQYKFVGPAWVYDGASVYPDLVNSENASGRQGGTEDDDNLNGAQFFENQKIRLC